MSFEDALAELKRIHQQDHREKEALQTEIAKLKAQIELFCATRTVLGLTDIPQMLVETRGNMTEVARRLGLNRNTVSRVVREKTDHLVLTKNGRYRYYSGFGDADEI